MRPTRTWCAGGVYVMSGHAGVYPPLGSSRVSILCPAVGWLRRRAERQCGSVARRGASVAVGRAYGVVGSDGVVC
eukprot:6609590-Prymnesium_polylepis.3